MPAETLRLKCNANRLSSTGKKLDLSLRLLQFFHPDGVDRVRARNNARNQRKNTEDPDAILNNPPPEIFRTDDDPVPKDPAPANKKLKDPPLANDTNEDDDVASDDDSTFPYARKDALGDTNANVKDPNANRSARKKSVTPPPQDNPDKSKPTGKEDREEIDLNDYIQQAVASAVTAAMRPVFEELLVNRDRTNLTEAENKALRSQLQNHNKTGIDFTIQNSQNLPNHDPTVTFSDPLCHNIPTPSDSAACGTTVSTGFAPATHASTTPTLPISKNPFPLPSLLKKELLAIEQGDYVDFDKIKPKKIDQRIREEEQEGFGIAMATYFDNDLGEETLRLKKVNTNRVEKLAEWLECWNKFSSARLITNPKRWPCSWPTSAK